MKLGNLKKITLRLDRQSLTRWGPVVRRHMAHFPKWLLLQHSHAVDLIAVILILVFASWTVVTLLYVDPPGVLGMPPATQELAVDTIDRLEFWIEEREANRGRTIPADRATLF